MAFELEGKIEAIFDAVQVNEKFRKREFLVDTGSEYNGQYYANRLKFQCVNHHCDMLNNVAVGQQVRVTFAHKGSTYEKDGKVHYITNLNCWKIDALTAAPVTYKQQIDNFNAQQPSAEVIDDLPF